MCRERERDDSKDDDNDDLLLSIWRKNIFTRRNDDNDILYYEDRGKGPMGPSGFSKYHPQE